MDRRREVVDEGAAFLLEPRALLLVELEEEFVAYEAVVLDPQTNILFLASVGFYLSSRFRALHCGSPPVAEMSPKQHP
jgi:hypothetical protein